jgi:alkyl sulfatase BDS1-like metallo-beta-lactamase superfamily hydrolase
MALSIQHARVLAKAVTVCVAPLAQAQGAAVGAPTAQVKHFDAKGNLPSTFTIELRKGVSATLPFEDQRDFDEAKKGFIAEPPFMKIMADAGNVAWDMASYQWLLQAKDFQSIHPSLQRQAVLNMAYGCPAGSTRCAASTWPTSASSRATPAGSSSTR